MPKENTNTDDGVNAVARRPGSRPPTSDHLDSNWMCDYDDARMKVREVREFDEEPHEVRECSADPNHVKIVKV